MAFVKRTLESGMNHYEFPSGMSRPRFAIVGNLVSNWRHATGNRACSPLKKILDRRRPELAGVRVGTALQTVWIHRDPGFHRMLTALPKT
jgi:hypothetical protein